MPDTFDAAAAAARLERRLAAAGTPARAVSEQAYLKSPLTFLGASVPAIRAAVVAFRREHPDLAHDDVVVLAEALWARPVHDCRMAAVELLDGYGQRLGPGDLPLLERLLREARTWALVDGLAASVAGGIADRHPAEAGPVLDRWAADGDFWLRRAALLALLIPLRRGDGDFGRFGRYADAMLEDPEFFIRKAIGWVLRDTARRRPELVADWLRPRVRRASGLTVREAAKRLPPEVRAELLAARG